jgi:RNA polymerase-binding transcription factor DksA
VPGYPFWLLLFPIYAPRYQEMAMRKTDDEVTGINVNDMRERLLKLQAQLQHDIEVKEREVAEDGDDLDPDRGGVSNHMADDANETSEQETMLTLHQAAVHQLDQVNVALERIEAGTYGTCANCGKEINPARLEARCESIYCIDCQGLADRGRI